jgi:phenylalanyl-tRNA synthetase beta chain
MKISINWLKDYVDADLSNSELIERLNSIGMLVDEWEEEGDDTILELETYANRPDTLGHLGVARELAASLGLPLNKPVGAIVEIDEPISDHFDIQILDEDLCSRYCGMLLTGIEVGPSPEWLQLRVRSMGLNPINNVVDVTNYVLFATAQPIHAFDVAKLEGRKIVVRRAKRGEHLITLEGEDVSLSQDMLVIADENKPVALAGIIGGQESAVTEATRDVLIESAYFDPVSVRQTWKKAGVQTDASYRFERGADLSFPPVAARLAASLLTQMGGRAYQGILDVFPKSRRPRTVVLRHHRISELLGVEVAEDFVVRTLTNLDFGVAQQQPGIWRVTVPSFRVDIEREADLIEEIARFFGYENIPSQLPTMETMDLVFDKKRELEDSLRILIFHNGFDEVVNYSFFNPVKENLFRQDRQSVAIRNPISSRAALLRTTLLDGLLQTVAWNRNRGAQGVHVFELGKVFSRNDQDNREQQKLGMVTWGTREIPHWQGHTEKTDFFLLKGACESLMSHMGYEPIVFQNQAHVFFQTNHALALHIKGSQVGVLGQVKPEIRAAYDIKEPVWAAEIDLDALFDIQAQAFHFTPVIKFPSMIRDVSFLVDLGVSYEEIKQAINRLNLSHLETYELYDRYTGSGVPKGKVSLSIRFTFRHPQKTLLAEEADSLQQMIVKALRSGFEFQLREGGEN